MIALALLVLTLVVAGGAALVAREIGAARRAATLNAVLATFGAPAARAADDPRELLSWFPVASAARQLFPEAFTRLDAAFGRTFPFSRDQVQAAHSRWTAEWLAWERNHDFEYRLKAAAFEQELERGGQSGTLASAQLERIEREKLERYQQRYEEYVRVAKALAALDPSTAPPSAAGAVTHGL